ncbi:nucleotide exchange factor GrpE [Buchnera aphidicola (Formosaphis micheliae)]|uniref:nucleotide exchange factor GrpE n=1 Tax=Buchnera aphidicola TaxID=9 RepID=UPI0031CC59D4
MNNDIYNLDEKKKNDCLENSQVPKKINDNDLIELKKQVISLKNNLLHETMNIEEEIKKVKIRAEKDIENIYKFSLEKFINEILSIIDNFERALQLSNHFNDDNYLEINSKLKQIIEFSLNVLKNFGVTVINKIDVVFNPDIHQAMSIHFSESIKENKIISIFQNGYLLNDRLLRPAIVSVSKNKKETI